MVFVKDICMFFFSPSLCLAVTVLASEWTSVFIAQRCRRRRPWRPILFLWVIMTRLYVRRISKLWMMPAGSTIMSSHSLLNMSSMNCSHPKQIISFNSSLHRSFNYWRWVTVRLSNPFFSPWISSRNDFFSYPSITTPASRHSPARIGHYSSYRFEVVFSIRSGIAFFFVALEKVLYHFDSMSSANDRTAKAVQEKFRLFFHQNIPVINCASPQQRNGYDCGLYVIVTVEELSRKILEYDPDGNKSDKDLLEKCTADLHRIISKDYVQQRREEFRTLVQSLSMERKSECSWFNSSIWYVCLRRKCRWSDFSCLFLSSSWTRE